MTADLFNPTCGSCEHYIEHAKEQGSGSCYRYPPTPLPIAVQPQQNIVTPEPVTQVTGNVAVGAMYPPVKRETIACGEYEQIEDNDSDA